MISVGAFGPLGSQVGLSTFEGSGCLMLTAMDERLPFVPGVCLGPSDVRTLISLLDDTLRDLPKMPVRSAKVVGQLAPRPMQLQLYVQHPGEEPVLKLRFLDGQRNFAHACSVTPAQASELLDALRQSVEPVVGHDGRWVGLSPEGRVKILQSDGAELELPIVEGITHVLGAEGEYLNLKELRADQAVRFWNAPADQASLLRVELPAYGKERPASTIPEDDFFSPMYRLGEVAEQSMLEGFHSQAWGAHQELANAMFTARQLDMFLCCKLTLSLLLRKVQALETEEAAAIWTQKPDHPVFKNGISGIESGELGDRDTVIYQFLSGYLYSLAVDKSGATDKVNGMMRRACETAKEREPELLPMGLRNWFLNLEEIHGKDKIPPKALGAWEAMRQSYPGTLVPRVPCYPRPDFWVIFWDADPQIDQTISSAAPSDFGITVPKKSFWQKLMGR